MKTIVPVRSWQCLICSKSFTRAHVLKRHEMIHTGEKPFQCEICLQKFTLRGNLKYHQVVHSNKRPFKCEICGKTYALLGTLKLHINMVHAVDGTKPHKCNLCCKEFFRRCDLVLHKRMHTGEKPFFCRFCQRAFSRRGNLRAHEELHINEADKPFQCGICSKRFSFASFLKTHSKMHHNKRRFSCHLCPQTFIRKRDQRVHTLRCQTKARTGLLEYGMSEEEAYLAVEPPLALVDDHTDQSDHEAIQNPYNLKECYVLLQRMSLVELK